MEVTKSTFSRTQYGVEVNARSVLITGSTISDTAGPSALAVTSQIAPPRVQNNVITGTAGGAGCLPSSFCQATVQAYGLLDLNLLTGNTGSGNAQQSFLLQGELTASGSLAALPAGWSRVVSGLTVASGVTLTVPAGTVVKMLGGGRLRVQGGSLLARGTATAPIVFTSIRDGSVGGATDTTAPPAAGDWAGITVSAAEGVATLDRVTLRYATTALDVADSGQATVHGAILNSTVGVSASSWVDATNVDWGHPSGPAPIGQGTPVQGDGVFVTPWIGYVVPARPPTSTDAPPVFVDCRRFLVIGARGSGEPPQGDPPSYADNADGFGSRAYDAYWGFKDYLASYGYADSDFKLLGLRYRALGIPYNPLNFGTLGYFDSIYEGVDNLVSTLYDQRAKCQNQRAILIGYSQGALVIHLALRELDRSDPSMLSPTRIAGVMLIADPAKISHASETTWEAEDQEASPDSGIDKASGIWTVAGLPNFGAVPSSVTARTIAICHNHDVVCAPGFRAWWGPHGSYSTSELNALGRWEAGRVLGVG